MVTSVSKLRFKLDPFGCIYKKKPCLGKYLGQFGTVWMHKFATKKIGGQSATQGKTIKNITTSSHGSPKHNIIYLHHFSCDITTPTLGDLRPCSRNHFTWCHPDTWQPSTHLYPSWEHVGTFQKGQSLNHFSIKKRSKVVQHKCISKQKSTSVVHLFTFPANCSKSNYPRTPVCLWP